MFQAKQTVVQDQELAVMLLRNLHSITYWAPEMHKLWLCKSAECNSGGYKYGVLQIKHCRFLGITNQFYCGIHAWTGLCSGMPSAIPANM